jgi:peptidoglycan/xylan/chitin deacetylase (PgdA/CDA1 family)
MSKSSRAYLCVSIDTECDKGKGWRSRKPMAFDGIHDGVVKRLQPMFDAFGAKATYLLSPEVLRDGACAEVFRRIADRAELGTHLHGEYAEPDAFEPDVTSVFQRDYPPDVERAKLTYLTDLFIRAFGEQPRSFRAGRFGIGSASIGILESLGYLVESSVTPHMDWTSSGAPGLAFLGAPTQPYRPDPVNPAKPGDAKLLEVPVTIRRRLLNALPFVGARIDPSWLRPTRGSEAGLVRVAEDEVADARRAHPGRPVILNAMFHNVEIVPGTSPYAESESQANGILHRLRALLAWAQREGVAVVGLGDVPEILAS